MKQAMARVIVVVCITLLWAGTALAGPTAGQQCAAAKMKAAGKKAQSQLNCHAKSARSGTTLALAACLSKAQAKFDLAFQKAESRGCEISGDATAVGSMVDDFVAAIVAAIPPGATPTPTLTPTITQTPTVSGTPTNTPTPKPTKTPTKTRTPTNTPTLTPTETPTETPTLTPTITPTWTPTLTPTLTPTSTPTVTPTVTITPTPPLVDNGDGTISDAMTGLMWEKKSDDGSIHDKDNTYTWSTGTNNPDGTAFSVFLATLNTTPCFAGHCDWRLPNEDGRNSPYTGLKELESILEGGLGCVSSPCVASVFDTNCAPSCTVTTCSCTQPNNYWSSTTYVSNPAYAWACLFNTGGTYGTQKDTPQSARAVRSLP